MPEEQVFDEVLGERGYNAHKEAAEGLAKASLRPLPSTARKLAREGLRVNAAIKQHDLRPRFKALATIEEASFDLRHVDELEGLSMALWYIHEAESTAQVIESGVKVSVEVMEAAREVRDRMLHVVSYHLKDNAHAMAEVASIRENTGYLDAVSDLSRSANLYKRYKPELAGDTRHWRAEDEAEPRRLATAILAELTAGSEAQWSVQAMRFWALLDGGYGEVRAAANLLFRKEPELLALFPSLITAARRP